MADNNGMVDGLHRVNETWSSGAGIYGISKGGLWGSWEEDIDFVLTAKWSSCGGNCTGGTLLVPEEML